MSLKIIFQDNVIGHVDSFSLSENFFEDIEYKQNIITVNNMYFKLSDIHEVFADGYLHTCSQKYPIHFIDESNNQKINNAWFTDNGKSHFISCHIYGNFAIIGNEVLEYESITNIN